MEYDALKLVLNQAVYLVLIIAATRGDWGLASTLWVIAIANLCDIAFGAGILAWKFFAPFSRTDRAAVKHLLREGGSLVIRRLIRTLGLRIDTFILTALKTKRDVGLHGGAYRLILQLRVLPNVLTTVFFPRLSRQWLDSPDQFKATYEQLLRLLVIIALPLVMLLTVLADPITTLVLGNKFLPAGRALMILSWGLGFLFLNSLSMSVLNAMDRQHLGIVAASAALVVNALLDVALIPRWSYLGAAVACTAAEAALLGICTYYITRQVGRTAWAPLIARPAWAALLTSAGLWLLQGLPVLILLPAALVGYGVALIGLRALTAQEIALFREVLGRRQKAEGRKQKAEGTR
jgi:O-antigen/teichoic acid export membrane protein